MKIKVEIINPNQGKEVNPLGKEPAKHYDHYPCNLTWKWIAWEKAENNRRVFKIVTDKKFAGFVGYKVPQKDYYCVGEIHTGELNLEKLEINI